MTPAHERLIVEYLGRIADALERVADAATTITLPAPVRDEGEAPSAGAGSTTTQGG